MTSKEFRDTEHEDVKTAVMDFIMDLNADGHELIRTRHRHEGGEYIVTVEYRETHQ